MEVVKVRKIGNSLGLLLSKDLIARLNVKEGDSLHIQENQDGINISPYDPEFERQMEVARKGMAKYKNALRELAK